MSLDCSHNKHTLKKRIRNVISLCIFITVFIFSAATVFITLQMFKVQATYISDHYSYSISQTMNSVYFLNQLGINGLEELNPDSSNVRAWLANLKSTEDISHIQNTIAKSLNTITTKSHISDPNDLSKSNLMFFNEKELVYTDIELNGKLLYTSVESSDSSSAKSGITSFNSPHNPKAYISQKILNYFSDTSACYSLLDSNGKEIGKVSSVINPNFLISIIFSIATLIIFAAILSLFIGNFMNKLLTMPITSPLKQLDEKIKAISGNNFDPDAQMQIVLKRPLREIESLAYSTNQIVNKMKYINNILHDQKLVLENQNHELESQNEELAESKRQIQEAQAMLVQSENMASIGQLTAAITHEINTPLGAINSNVQLTDMLIGNFFQYELINENEALKELATQLKESNSISLMACQRVSEIIRSLKTFSKLDQAEFQEANINEGIKSVLVLTSNLWKNKISIVEDFENLPLVKCFPGLLNQVFMNIIVNSIESIEQKGEISIKTFSTEKDIFVKIKDTGCGIKDEHLSHIFDSGFSTKGIGVGAGLGLSICKNIIKKHNGDINVTSQINEGTEFTVRIPFNKD